MSGYIGRALGYLWAGGEPEEEEEEQEEREEEEPEEEEEEEEEEQQQSEEEREPEEQQFVSPLEQTSVQTILPRTSQQTLPLSGRLYPSLSAATGQYENPQISQPSIGSPQGVQRSVSSFPSPTVSPLRTRISPAAEPLLPISVTQKPLPIPPPQRRPQPSHALPTPSTASVTRGPIPTALSPPRVALPPQLPSLQNVPQRVPRIPRTTSSRARIAAQDNASSTLRSGIASVQNCEVHLETAQLDRCLVQNRQVPDSITTLRRAYDQDLSAQFPYAAATTGVLRMRSQENVHLLTLLARLLVNGDVATQGNEPVRGYGWKSPNAIVAWLKAELTNIGMPLIVAASSYDRSSASNDASTADNNDDWVDQFEQLVRNYLDTGNSARQRQQQLQGHDYIDTNSPLGAIYGNWRNKLLLTHGRSAVRNIIMNEYVSLYMSIVSFFLQLGDSWTGVPPAVMASLTQHGDVLLDKYISPAQTIAESPIDNLNSLFAAAAVTSWKAMYPAPNEPTRTSRIVGEWYLANNLMATLHTWYDEENAACAFTSATVGLHVDMVRLIDVINDNIVPQDNWIVPQFYERIYGPHRDFVAVYGRLLEGSNTTIIEEAFLRDVGWRQVYGMAQSLLVELYMNAIGIYAWKVSSPNIIDTASQAMGFYVALLDFYKTTMATHVREQTSLADLYHQRTVQIEFLEDRYNEVQAHWASTSRVIDIQPGQLHVYVPPTVQQWPVRGEHAWSDILRAHDVVQQDIEAMSQILPSVDANEQ